MVVLEASEVLVLDVLVGLVDLDPVVLVLIQAEVAMLVVLGLVIQMVSGIQTVTVILVVLGLVILVRVQFAVVTMVDLGLVDLGLVDQVDLVIQIVVVTLVVLGLVGQVGLEILEDQNDLVVLVTRAILETNVGDNELGSCLTLLRVSLAFLASCFCLVVFSFNVTVISLGKALADCWNVSNIVM